MSSVTTGEAVPALGYPDGSALQERALRVMPGGVNSATRFIGPPYAFTRGEGQYLWDADGHRYVDYHAAFGAMLLGHNDRGVNAAAGAALESLDLVGLGVTEIEVRLAETIVRLVPSAEQVILCTSGSEAVSYAVRLARGATGRRYLVKAQGCFHGWHDAVARNVISTPERAYALDPLSGGILPDALDATLVAEFNDLASFEELFDRFPGQIAGVIVEPIPHNVGTLLPAEGFLQGLRDLTRREGAVLVFDEVITGFRHALGGYQEICGVVPDLTTFGKAMGNGFPIAGLAGSHDLMHLFNSSDGDVLLAGTFSGHPASAGAALETIDRLRTTDFYDTIFALGDRMRQGLRDAIDDLGLDGFVAGFGSVFVLYFLKERPSGYRDLLADNDTAYRDFHRRMTDKGFLMLPLALKRNHISASHTAGDIDDTVDAARTVLADMRSAGTV